MTSRNKILSDLIPAIRVVRANGVGKRVETKSLSPSPTVNQSERFRDSRKCELTFLSLKELPSECVLTKPLHHWGGWDTRSIKSTAGLNSEFSFRYTGCITETKNPSLLNYSTIVRGGRDGFMPFQKALTQRETQRASKYLNVRWSSRVWIRVINSISYDNNLYTEWAFS